MICIDQVSELSDFSFQSANRSPSQLEFQHASAASSPQLQYSDNHRFSAASTSSSYSHTSTAGDSGQSGIFLAPPSSSGRLRNQSSDATIEAVHASVDQTSRPTTSIYAPPESPERQRMQRRQDTVKNYVCTYCNKDFGGKSDWKRHETTFHEPQHIWQCPVCNRSFNSKRKFSTHHGRDHDCPEDCEHATEAQKTLPIKRAFGCGFQSCNQVLYSWDERCNHVAKHFEDGEMKENWHYTTVIKNLLRQDKLADSWRAFLTEIYGPRELWPQLSWRQVDTRELKERLEFGTFEDISDILHEAHRLAVGKSTNRSEMPRSLSDPLVGSQDPIVVNPFSENVALENQSRVDAMGVAGATVPPDHSALAAEMYPGATLADAGYGQYYQTVTPPGEVGSLAAHSYHGLPQANQAPVYQQMQYNEQVGFQTPYQMAHPVPFPPVPSNNILASDTFYSPRPIMQTQRPSLPPQPQSAPPVPPTPPQTQHERSRSKTTKQSLGKRLFGLSSRKSSGTHTYEREGSDSSSQSPIDSVEPSYLPAGFHPDSFF